MSVLEVSAGNPDSSFHLDQEVLDSLSSQLRGARLIPSSRGYNDARVIWNGLADKRPAIIVQCTGAADVMDALRFARKHGLQVAVRGGGHNVAGNASCDGGLVIDLSSMNAVLVDH